MNHYESIPPRPGIPYSEVLEWTDNGRAVLEDGRVVSRREVDYLPHWADQAAQHQELHPEAAQVIKAIEIALANDDYYPFRYTDDAEFVHGYTNQDAAFLTTYGIASPVEAGRMLPID